MVTERLTTDDVLNLMSGKLEVQLPDYMACNSAKSLLSYVRNAYADRFINGKVLTASVDAKTHVVTIEYKYRDRR